MRYVLMLSMLMATGCAFIKPTTEIKMNPFTRTVSIHNTKNVDLAFDEFIILWTDKGGELTMRGFRVSDDATGVIEANVEQMLAFVEQQKAANEGIKASLAEIAKMVNSLAVILGRPTVE